VCGGGGGAYVCWLETCIEREAASSTESATAVTSKFLKGQRTAELTMCTLTIELTFENCSELSVLKSQTQNCSEKF